MLSMFDSVKDTPESIINHMTSNNFDSMTKLHKHDGTDSMKYVSEMKPSQVVLEPIGSSRNFEFSGLRGKFFRSNNYKGTVASSVPYSPLLKGKYLENNNPQ